MPNWCSSSYVIEGDKKEVKKLYGIMHGLEKRKTPAVKNGFGTAWLGCLVNALGADWNKVYCRGDWSNLEMEQDTLKFSTETAWGPCNEVFDLIRQKFPSLSYYFLSEEPGMGVFQTMIGMESILQINFVPIFVLQKKSTSANILRISQVCSNGWKRYSDSQLLRMKILKN